MLPGDPADGPDRDPDGPSPGISPGDGDAGVAEEVLAAGGATSPSSPPSAAPSSIPSSTPTSLPPSPAASAPYTAVIGPAADDSAPQHQHASEEGEREVEGESDRELRRNLPGTQAAHMWKWGPRPISRSSPLGIAEYIQDVIREDASDIQRINQPPSDDIDLLVWQYEHLRQFVIEFNHLLVALSEECTRETCPRMTASNDWQYLCAAHRTPQDCPAIDYITHTIDGTTALLTNAKHFPSRTEVQPGDAKYFQSMSRRLYRIFSHVFFHHRQIFEEIEAETHLHDRFWDFVTRFQLMSQSMLLVPLHRHPEPAAPTGRATEG